MAKTGTGGHRYQLVGDTLSTTITNTVKLSLKLFYIDSHLYAEVSPLGFSNESIPIDSRHASVFQHWLYQKKMCMGVDSLSSDSIDVSCHKAAFFWVHPN